MSITTVEGKFILEDGTEVQFLIDRDGNCQSWGANREAIGQTVDAREAMERALREAGAWTEYPWAVQWRTEDGTWLAEVERTDSKEAATALARRGLGLTVAALFDLPEVEGAPEEEQADMPVAIALVGQYDERGAGWLDWTEEEVS